MKVKSSLKFASFAAGAVVLYIYLTCFTFISGTEECKAGKSDNVSSKQCLKKMFLK
jgi:hypothetical protein